MARYRADRAELDDVSNPSRLNGLLISPPTGAVCGRMVDVGDIGFASLPSKLLDEGRRLNTFLLMLSPSSSQLLLVTDLSFVSKDARDDPSIIASSGRGRKSR